MPMRSMLAGGRVHAAPADPAGGGGGAGGGDIIPASPPTSPTARRASADDMMVLSKVKIFSAAMKDHGECCCYLTECIYSSVLESQLPHEIVNLLFTTTTLNIKLTVLWRS